MSEPAHHTYRSQVDFSSDQIHEGSPATEFRQRPDRFFELEFFNRRLRFDDGAEHEIWSFETPGSGRGLPGPPLRVTEGEILHALLKPSKGPHTLHWHGIEPDPRNDGVGHTSFEVTGEYTYQWRPEPGVPGNPNRGASGTYFYHCHVNTVLHVQMGMFGPLIIDPVAHPDYPVRPGTRRVFVDGPEYDIDTETLLVPYSVDPRWHDFTHAAGLSGEDVGLNRFEPKHFYTLGGELARRPPKDAVWSLSRIRATVSPGKAPTLLRVVNANYFPARLRFSDSQGNPVRMAELVSHDGRAFRDTSSPDGECPPLGGSTTGLHTDILAFGAAERYDVLLRPPAPGQYLLTLELENWITRAVLKTRVIPIAAA